MLKTFLQGAGNVISDAVQGVRDVFVARETAKSDQAKIDAANVASGALAASDLNKFRVIAFVLAGIAAIVFFNRSAKA